MIQMLLASEAEYDTVLFENEQVLVTAALGGFVPLWLILWPKKKSQTICGANAQLRFPQIHLVQSVFTAPVVGEALWFEHGSNKPGNAIGCGVDCAHLHVVLDTPVTLGEFREHAAVRAGHGWSEWKTGYVEEGSDYHAFGQGTESFMQAGTRDLGSQFFRRVLARLTGISDYWDYRKYPFPDNSRATNKYVRENRSRIFVE